MHDVETQLGDYWTELVADYPVPSAVELMAPSAPSIDSAVHSVETEADGPRGDALMFDSRWHVNESTAPAERKRWIGALTAVAAAVLIVAGVVVLARDSVDVVPEAPSRPSSWRPSFPRSGFSPRSTRPNLHGPCRQRRSPGCALMRHSMWPPWAMPSTLALPRTTRSTASMRRRLRPGGPSARPGRFALHPPS